jgi:hypothetical protein
MITCEYNSMTFPNHPDIDEAKLEELLDVCAKQHVKIHELRDGLLDKTRRLEQSEAEASDLRDKLYRENALRPSLEVLQRMANGLDPFDIGRFKCAMAALPHEVPKLSATVGIFGNIGIGDRLDRVTARRPNDRLRLVENGVESASE